MRLSRSVDHARSLGGTAEPANWQRGANDHHGASQKQEAIVSSVGGRGTCCGTEHASTVSSLRKPLFASL